MTIEESMHQGKNVLVVDDNTLNAKLAQFILGEAGFMVETAACASTALVAIRCRPPDIILMDLQLPDVDGLTLTEQLKGSPETRDIVIIAVTAFAMKGDSMRAFAAGCDGYITKPIDPSTLASEVEDVAWRARGPR